jgi:glyoxylase-like metal-dependent hydrolase (beta-lactamase superfamily II)
LTAWGKFGNLLLRLYSPFLNINPFEVDIVLSDDEFSLDEYDIPGMIIHTPGHTKGLLAY